MNENASGSMVIWNICSDCHRKSIYCN